MFPGRKSRVHLSAIFLGRGIYFLAPHTSVGVSFGFHFFFLFFFFSLSFFSFFFFFFFFFLARACSTSMWLKPGIETRLHRWKHQVLTTRSPGRSQVAISFVDLNDNLFENSFWITNFLKPLPFCSVVFYPYLQAEKAETILIWYFQMNWLSHGHV